MTVHVPDLPYNVIFPALGLAIQLARFGVDLSRDRRRKPPDPTKKELVSESSDGDLGAPRPKDEGGDRRDAALGSILAALRDLRDGRTAT